MTTAQKMDRAVSFAFQQVDYLETWLRSIERKLSEMGENDPERNAWVAERKAILADIHHRDEQYSELIEERAMLRREKHRARRQIRVA